MWASVFKLKAAIRTCTFVYIAFGDVASELLSGAFVLGVISEVTSG